MARYINADSLLDYLHSLNGHELISLKAVRQSIDSEPTVDVREVMASAWIPVSERLPDDESDVLCTAHSTYRDSVGESEFRGGKFYVTREDGNEEDVTPLVTAWMPKPEPYRGKE